MRRRTILIIILVILAVVGYRYYIKKAEKKAELATEVATGIPVELAKVRLGDITKVVSASGTIKAEREVNVITKIPGKVSRVYCKEGDYVRRGEVVIGLEDDEIKAQVNQAQAALAVAKTRDQLAQRGARPQERQQVDNALAQAKAGLDLAKSNYERMKVLHEHGSISTQMWEGVEMQYKLAKASYDSARQQQSIVDEGARVEDKEAAKAGVAQARAALAYAQTMLKNTVIRAPISGIVFMRNVDPGEMAAPGMPLLILVDNSSLYLEVEVGEKEVEQVKRGNKVNIWVDAIPNKEFTGYVKEIVLAINPFSRTFKVKISISDKERLLKSGMFARCQIEIRRHENIVLVPRESIQERRGKEVVFTLSNNRAVLREVEPGINDEKNYEIKEGIKEGEKIVVVGQTNLDDGVLVKVISEK